MSDGALASLLACVAAFARSLEQAFDPQGFLGEFSARAQALVPHDGMLIVWLEDEGRAFSAFARHVCIEGPRLDFQNYTIAFDPGGRFPRHAAGFESIFEGESQLVADALSADGPSDATLRAWASASGFRARVGVPLYASGRAVGALLVASVTPGRFTGDHVDVTRQIADLIAPFVENVVMFQRERRRRERLQSATSLAPMLGTSLQVTDVLERLGEALRPTLDFDMLGVSLLRPGGEALERIGLVRPGHPMQPLTIPIGQSSFLGRVREGQPVVVRDVEIEMDRSLPVDRQVIGTGNRSIMMVPLLFGGQTGGALFFGKNQPSWYDQDDVEIGRVIAATVVLGVQHQRLAEERERTAVAEAATRHLARRVQSLRGALEERFGFDTIIGHGPSFVAAITQARRVAPTDTTVLLTGDSGTGKEVLARAIHQASPRTEGPFVAINCAALPETLIESELFGHERGAFTGADKLKRGRFELAHGGTLFLDEVGELTLPVQAKLLRVLQERRYERVGGTATLGADVRLVAATNRDLERAVAQGSFREDLFYRLAVFRVHLPPLRERGNDILVLADRFLRDLGARMSKGDVGLSAEARDALLAHHWPGNIRELQNALERAVILSDGGLIAAADLGLARGTTTAQTASTPGQTPPGASAATRAPVAVSAPTSGAGTGGFAAPAAPLQSLPELERQALIEALKRSNGNKSHAAAALGLTRTRFYTLLKRFGLH